MRIKVEIIKIGGLTCNFLKRRERKKMLTGYKPFHLYQHAAYQKENDMIAHPLTQLNSNFNN
jgi:hypothetical protein